MKNKLRLVFTLSCALAIGTPAQFQRGVWAGGIEPDEPRDALPAQLSPSTTDAVQDALKIANRNLKRRSKSAPDAQYVVTLEQSLLRRHEGRRGGEVLIFTPTTDPALLGSRTFGLNLRRLFELKAHAQDIDSDPRMNTFIVGGLPIPSAVDVVGVTSSEEGLSSTFCSGVMIAANRILTAAHCVCSGAANFVRVGDRMLDRNAYSSYRVTKRALFLDQSFCPTASPAEAPASFRARVQQETKGRDLAILEVGQDIVEGQPRALLNAATFDNWRRGDFNYFVRAAGIGYSEISPTGALRGAGNRLFADIAIAAPDCSAADAASFGCSKGRELVAAGHPAHQIQGPTPDTCGGDSGGPIFGLMRHNGKKLFYVLGVTSRGTSSACGSGGIYTLVTNEDTHEWLKTKGAQFLE